jgi:hypothetical protein
VKTASTERLQEESVELRVRVFGIATDIKQYPAHSDEIQAASNIPNTLFKLSRGMFIMASI